MYQTTLGINDWKYMEIIYVNCGLKMDLKGIFAVMNTTYTVEKILPEKKFRLEWDLNPWPLQYWYSALPTLLSLLLKWCSLLWGLLSNCLLGLVTYCEVLNKIWPKPLSKLRWCQVPPTPLSQSHLQLLQHLGVSDPVQLIFLQVYHRASGNMWTPT